MHEYTPVEKRHLARGLRHKLIGSPEEIAKYETEVQNHLRDDAQDHIEATKKQSEKKDGLEGLGSK
jgi:hypothetical protein